MMEYVGFGGSCKLNVLIVCIASLWRGEGWRVGVGVECREGRRKRTTGL